MISENYLVTFDRPSADQRDLLQAKLAIIYSS